MGGFHFSAASWSSGHFRSSLRTAELGRKQSGAMGYGGSYLLSGGKNLFGGLLTYFDSSVQTQNIFPTHVHIHPATSLSLTYYCNGRCFTISIWIKIVFILHLMEGLLLSESCSNSYFNSKVLSWLYDIKKLFPDLFFIAWS